MTIALPGDYGKPRPALVVQSDLFDALSSVTILPVTSTVRAAPLLRITIKPTERNALRRESQVMVDNVQTVPREKVGAPFGRLGDDSMLAVDRALAVFLGIA